MDRVKWISEMACVEDHADRVNRIPINESLSNWEINRDQQARNWE